MEDKIKAVKKLVELADELGEYNQLTRWQRIKNWFLIKLGKRLIENLVIDPKRRKILEKRAGKLQKRIYGKTNNRTIRK